MTTLTNYRFTTPGDPATIERQLPMALAHWQNTHSQPPARVLVNPARLEVAEACRNGHKFEIAGNGGVAGCEIWMEA